MLLADGIQEFSNIVDIFNATAGTWRAANLSQARFRLAATSLPNYGLAIFAGGQGKSCGDDCSDCSDALGGHVIFWEIHA
jgi:hypothetical protein